MDFDVIVVGGGSAGCAMASRLSEDPTRRVLLCEAGDDLTDATMPADIASSYPGTAYVNRNYLWPDLTVRSIEGAPPRPYAQARILGGGSSINGQMANWGVPTDYDEWETLGATGWSWRDVFPFFRKLEHDLDFGDNSHGQHGPFTVRRLPRQTWSRHAQAAGEAFTRLGYPYLEDQNGDFTDGWFPLVHANVDNRRISAATTYLSTTVRSRPNLRIMTRAQVSGLIMDGKSCTGIKVWRGDGEESFLAREIVICAGAIHSPAILLRAGIGPAGQLREAGIPVIADRAGVGQGLMDHPQVALGSFLTRDARLANPDARHVEIGLRYSSGLADVPSGDMMALCISRTAWHPVGRQLGALAVWVNKTLSNEGEVRIRSGDWRKEPDVDFRLLSHRGDLTRLVDGWRMLAAAQIDQAMQGVATEPFPASYTDKARQVGAVNARNRRLTSLFARLLDGPAPLRRMLMRRFVMSEHDFRSVMVDDDAAEAFVRGSVAGIWHASCSCRMGRADDLAAVTTNEGRVHGIGNLRVADASIFPSVPSANTNIPTLMVAEKIAQKILTSQ